jgi:hypothetical protein
MCETHREEYDRTHHVWPVCPKCGKNEFGVMIWGGDVASTKALCGDCGFSTLATKYFDNLTIKIISSPIESR